MRRKINFLIGSLICLAVLGSSAFAATVTLDAGYYYPESVVAINVSDSTKGDQNVYVKINSTSDSSGIIVSELADGSGLATILVTFNASGNSNQASKILAVSDNDLIEIFYPQTNTTVADNATFNLTVNATISLNDTIFSPSETVSITINDSDANTNAAAQQSFNVTVNSTTAPTGINVTVYEDGANTSIFIGNFTFNGGGGTLSVSAGDLITAKYNETYDTSGLPSSRYAFARAASDGSVSLGASTYYSSSTANVTVNDTDMNLNSSLQETLVVNLTSAKDGTGINITLTETGNNTGIFASNFTFNYSGTSSSSNKILGVNHDNTITAYYYDRKNWSSYDTMTLSANSNFQYRVNATIIFSNTPFGPKTNATVTVYDNDTDANVLPSVKDTITIILNSTSNSTGVSMVLFETGNNTGIFTGWFNFTVNGNNYDNDSTKEYTINVSDLNNVTVTYTDSSNSYGLSMAVSDTTIFYDANTGSITMNSTDINANNTNNLIYAFKVNDSVEVNLSDVDLDGVSSIVVVIVNENSPSETINLTLYNYTAFGDFTGNFTISNETNQTLRNIKAVNNDIILVRYNDSKTEEGSNEWITEKIWVIGQAPSFSAFTRVDTDVYYMDGDVITFNVTLDMPGATLSANFSSVDSLYSAGLENVSDLGSGVYQINYTIKSGNTKTDGNKTIILSATDALGAGNSNDTFWAVLSNVFIPTALVDFGAVSSTSTQAEEFNITNDGSMNQTLSTPAVTLFKRKSIIETFTDNTTKTYYFLVPKHVINLTTNVASNNSNTSVSVSLTDPSGDGQNANVTTTEEGVWKLQVTTTGMESDTLITVDIDAYLNPTNFGIAIQNVSTLWYNGSTTNNTVKVNLTLSEPIFAGVYNGTIKYQTDNLSVSVPYTFNVSYPELWIWSSIYGTDSPVEVQNDTITFKVNKNTGINSFDIYVTNNGSIAITSLLANLSSRNFTYGSSKVTITLDNVQSTTVSNVTGSVSFGSVPATGSARKFRITVNVTGKPTGNYTTSLFFNSSGTDKARPYTTRDITLKLEITSDLNVTIVGVPSGNLAANSPHIFNVSVKYQNGTDIADLNKNNVSVVLKDTLDTSNSYSFPSINSLTWDSSEKHYRLNISLPDMVGGNFTLQITANEPNGNNAGTDSETFKVSGPYLYIYSALSCSSTSLVINDTTTCSLKFRNKGTSAVNDLDLTLDACSSTYVEITGATKANQNVSASETKTFSWTIKGKATKSACGLRVKAETSQSNEYFWDGTDIGDYLMYSSYKYVNVTAASSSISPDDGSSDDSTSDSGDDSSDIYAGVLEIKSIPSLVAIEQGKYYAFTVNIKNSGNKSLSNIGFSLSLPSGVSWTDWYSVKSTLPTSLAGGVSSDVKLRIDVPENVTVKEYTITAKLTGGGLSTTKTFTLRVKPGTEEKKSLNNSLLDLQNELQNITEQLYALMESSKDNENLTSLNTRLTEAKTLYADYESAINNSDYWTAHTKKAELSALLNEMKTLLDSEKTVIQKQKKRKNTLFFSTILLILVAAFINFIYLPSRKEYDSDKGFLFSEDNKTFKGKIMKLSRQLMDGAVNSAHAVLGKEIKKDETYKVYKYGQKFKSVDHMTFTERIHTWKQKRKKKKEQKKLHHYHRKTKKVKVKVK